MLIISMRRSFKSYMNKRLVCREITLYTEMLTQDIIAIATLPFPYIAFFVTVIAAVWVSRYRGDISPIIDRLMDSKDHLDQITRHVAANIVVIQHEDVHIVRPKSDSDIVINLD